MTLHTLLMTQTIAGVLGIVPAAVLGVGTIVSAANAQNNLRLASFVIGVALSFPFVLALSLVAMWMAHHWGEDRITVAFLILPWAHFTLLVSSTLGLFRSRS